MKLLSILLALAAITVSADPEADACAAAAGTYMTGVVSDGPTFKTGSYRQGVELSHTHVQLINDADNNTYDIAIDNVYADGYDNAGENVPDPLTSLVPGTHIELCGLPFPGGMHWVHSNCGVTPSRSQPDGWVKIIDDSTGNIGSNLEESQEYCYLWGN
ncbi:MAG: hypothetical protein JO218_02075 [Burkholderiales bacterium]|nr:hypothetical protein [Burkholderiales bacterium]